MKELKLLIIGLGLNLIASICQASPTENVFNIRSFGATGDGVAKDTTAIQEAIDACHASGGGIVRVPTGDFQIGTIRLKSNITLSLDYGASLLSGRVLFIRFLRDEYRD